MIRFIHAADLHLDTPFSGLEQTSKKLTEKLKQAPFQSFEKIVDIAIAKEVDFVLLAGDLYNTRQVNIRAQSLFIEQLNRLKQFEIAVFLIRGNHDYLTEATQRLALPLPDNVYTFSDEVETHIFETKGKQRVAVSGFSYNSQWISERKINSYPARLPNVDMHIGLLHGAIESTQTKAANYAPFSMKELQQKNYDYWALGHIHQFEQVLAHPLAYYSGNIQGLHKNETGEKGCLFVEWNSRGNSVDFIPTAPILWDKINVSLAGTEDISTFIKAVKTIIQEKNYKKPTLLHLRIILNKDTPENIINYIQKQEFKAQLTQQLDMTNIWVVSMDITMEAVSEQQSLETTYPTEWMTSLDELAEATNFNEITENIFNQIPAKYLSAHNSKEYRAEMINKAITKIHFN